MSRCLCCKKLKELHKLRGCLYCDDIGPYCKNGDAEYCQTCGEGNPGNWTCGEGSNHYLPKGGFKTKCIECDEFYYCDKCVSKCQCGKGVPHYLCRKKHDDEHRCKWSSKDDRTWCNVMVCRKYCGIEDLSGEIVLYCPDHKPSISESLRDAVVYHIKANESEAYKAQLIEELIKK